MFSVGGTLRGPMRHLPSKNASLTRQCREQCLPGSLTGAVSCKRVTQEYKGLLTPDGNRSVSVKVYVGLTARATTRADAKAGLSDPLIEYGFVRAYRIKVTPGITE